MNIFSATDVSTLIEIARYQAIGNAYMVVIAPGGIHYVMYFNGNHSDMPAVGSYTRDQLDNWNEDQWELQLKLLRRSEFIMIVNGKSVLNNKGLEQIFFDSLKKMDLDNKITLQKIEGNQVSTVNQNSNGTTTPVPCQ